MGGGHLGAEERCDTVLVVDALTMQLVVDAADVGLDEQYTVHSAQQPRQEYLHGRTNPVCWHTSIHGTGVTAALLQPWRRK